MIKAGVAIQMLAKNTLKQEILLYMQTKYNFNKWNNLSWMIESLFPGLGNKIKMTTIMIFIQHGTGKPSQWCKSRKIKYVRIAKDT